MTRLRSKVANVFRKHDTSSSSKPRAKIQLIIDFLREVRQWSGPEGGEGWWCPMTATYTPAGGALQATLTGHSDNVNCVKYRPQSEKSERSMFVTASDDKTLKVPFVCFFCVYVRVRDGVLCSCDSLLYIDLGWSFWRAPQYTEVFELRRLSKDCGLEP